MEKLKILIIDPKEDNIPVYTKYLIDEIFETKSRNDGKAGLELYQTWKPNFVILDLLLPVISGYVLLKEIRQELHDETTPIIIATKVSKKETIMDCAKIGIQGYIVKPFSAEEITGKMLKCITKINTEVAQQATEAIFKFIDEKENR